MGHGTPEERPLNSDEHKLWKQARIDYIRSEYLDPIEMAARDCRVVGALKFIVLGTPEHQEYDFEEVSWQIGQEYMLGPDEIMTAFDLAEDKILREQV